MRKLNLEETKARELDILKDVVSFCEKNGIHYILVYGTMLGAIRHKGFIPWDDDVDISMPRTDYERFLSLYKSEKYGLAEYSLNDDYPYVFAKVMDGETVVYENTNSKYPIGVYIDVFPIDGLPKEQKMRESHSKKIGRLYHLLLWKNISLKYPTDIIHKLLHVCVKFLLLPISRKNLILRHLKLIKKYSFDNSDYVIDSDGNIIKRTYFKETVYTDFEDVKCKVPKDYDGYLKGYYGDYMAPPPEDKRIPHYFEAYVKEKDV